MRVLVVSDTHGRLDNLKRALKAEKDLSFLIHCGDVEEQEEEVRAAAKIPCLIVRGNNDYSTRLAFDETVELAGHRIFVTHGHRLGVSWHNGTLFETARSHGAELAFYGHTHFPEIDRSHPLVTAANPGSLTFPRQDGRKPSYLIAELEEGRKPELFLHFLKRERGLFW